MYIDIFLYMSISKYDIDRYIYIYIYISMHKSIYRY